jgi:hypothetical protein
MAYGDHCCASCSVGVTPPIHETHIRDICNFGWPTASGAWQLARDVAENVNGSLLRASDKDKVDKDHFWLGIKVLPPDSFWTQVCGSESNPTQGRQLVRFHVQVR